MDPNQAPQAQPMAMPTAAPISMPSSQWPGAFGIYEVSKRAVKFNLKTNLVLGTLLGITSVISNVDVEEPSAALITTTLVTGILSLVFGVSLIASTNASARSEKYTLNQAFKKGFSFLAVKYFVQAIVTMLILIGSLLALVIPFFFVAPRLLLAPYFLVDKDMGPIEALKASWHQTKGHSLKVWSIFGVTALMGIAILILVGLYFLLMYMAAYSLLYLYVSGQQSIQATEGAAPAQPTTVPTEGPITYAKPPLQ